MNEETKKTHRASCAACESPREERICMSEEGRSARGCPTLTRTEVLEAANRAYGEDSLKEFARQASIQEAECYANRDRRPYVMQPTKTRIVEICEFAKKMGYGRLGLAFCMGLTQEAGLVEGILRDRGFEVVSVACKAGRTPKRFLDLGPEETIRLEDGESMCNPVFQAHLLNHEKAEFNVLLGLCVGHDSLFFRHAEAPTTVLAVKDRVTGHNPLAAVYLSGSYYGKIRHPGL